MGKAVTGMLAVMAAALSGCGYHVSGHGDLLPKTLHTVAIPPFDNITTRYKLTDRLPESLTREFLARTRYQIVQDPNQADAVLRGSVIGVVAYPTVFDQTTGRASGLQINVTLQVRLIERETGRVLFVRPSMDVKEVYEISTAADTRVYFEESETALARLSRDVARRLVSAILEAF